MEISFGVKAFERKDIFQTQFFSQINALQPQNYLTDLNKLYIPKLQVKNK